MHYSFYSLLILKHFIRFSGQQYEYKKKTVEINFIKGKGHAFQTLVQQSSAILTLGTGAPMRI